jgi:hypothetical protein
MRYARLTAATVASLVLGLAITAPTVIAQDADADHPAVGTWADPAGGAYLLLLPDGGAIGSDPYGGVVFGNWQASGERTADLTVRGPDKTPGAAPGATVLARAVIEVAEDGATAAVTATLEQLTPDGGSSGQYGPLMVSVQRLGVEPMGEPIGPLPEAGPMASASPMAAASPMAGASPSPGA